MRERMNPNGGLSYAPRHFYLGGIMQFIQNFTDLGVLGILMFIMCMYHSDNNKIISTINSLTVAINRLLDHTAQKQEEEDHD